MSSFRHLLHWLRHDAARFRDFLLCWVGLALVFFLWVWSLNARVLTAEKVEWEAMRIFGWMLLAYETAVVALILSSDPLLGADEHWKTLPVPVWILPLAKTLLVTGAFLGLPALLESLLIWRWGNPTAVSDSGIQSGIAGVTWLLSLTGLPIAAALCVSARTTGIYGTLANALIAGLAVLAVTGMKVSWLTQSLLAPLLLLLPVAALFYVTARSVRATSRVSSFCQILLPVTLLACAVRINAEFPDALRPKVDLDGRQWHAATSPSLRIPARHAVFPSVLKRESLSDPAFLRERESRTFGSAFLLSGGLGGRKVTAFEWMTFNTTPVAHRSFFPLMQHILLSGPYDESPSGRQLVPFQFRLDELHVAEHLNTPLSVRGRMRLRFSGKEIRLPVRDGGEYADSELTIRIRHEPGHDGAKYPDYYLTARHRSWLPAIAAYLVQPDGSRFPVRADLSPGGRNPLQHGYSSVIGLRTEQEGPIPFQEGSEIELHLLRPGDFVDVPIVPGSFAFHNSAEPSPDKAASGSRPLTAENPEGLPAAIHNLMMAASASGSLAAATRELNSLSRAQLPALLRFASDNADVLEPPALWDPLLRETLCRLLTPGDLAALRADPPLLRYLRQALQERRPDLAAQLPPD